MFRSDPTSINPDWFSVSVKVASMFAYGQLDPLTFCSIKILLHDNWLTQIDERKALPLCFKIILHPLLKFAIRGS